MRIDRAKLSDISSWILVLCVLLTTTLVVRREFVQDSTATVAQVTKTRAIQIDGWEDALTLGIRSGPADAPVQVIEFADFQCPYCARFEATVRTVRDKYPDQVAFTFVHFPLSQHSFAESAARAAECAHIQGRFEPMRSLLFEQQQEFGSIPWTDFAKQARIPNVQQFDTCMNDTRPVERLGRSRKLADKMGVQGTPTVIVNGWMVPAPPSAEDMEKIVNNILDGRQPTAQLDFLATAARN